MSWTVLGYRRPYLLAEAVREDAGTVVLVSHGDEYDLVGDAGAEERAELVALLQDLRDPASARWDEARAECAELLAELDRLGLVRDADGTGLDVVEREAAEVAAAVAGAYAWLAEARGLVPADRFDAVLATVAGSAAGTPYAGDNLYLEVLDLQLRYWRRCAPLSVAAVAALLERLGAPAPAPPAVATGAEYGPDDVCVHLDCLTALVVLACRDDAARRCRPPAAPPDGPCTGTNFVLEAERAGHAALRALGTSRYHDRLVAGSAPPRLAEGTYVEQYHATRRYVEVVTPLLAKRFRDDLRAALFAYYDEEIGHEKYELATCVELGLDEAGVRAAVPVPLWTSFIDVLSELAENEPVSLLTCLIATEGMPSSREQVNDLLADQGLLGDVDPNAHEELNEELDHVTLARRLVGLVPSVPAADQARAVDRLLLVLELGVRGWDMLHDYYTAPDTPRYRTWLAVPPGWYLS